jgi:hypothetical protein
MGARRVRVLFWRPGEAEAAHNVWADLDAEAGELTLLHDYGEDLRPAPGWAVAAGPERYEVSRVDGRVLALAPSRSGGA